MNKLSYKNIHMRLGNVRYYSTRSPNNKKKLDSSILTQQISLKKKDIKNIQQLFKDNYCTIR